MINYFLNTFEIWQKIWAKFELLQLQVQERPILFHLYGKNCEQNFPLFIIHLWLFLGLRSNSFVFKASLKSNILSEYRKHLGTWEKSSLSWMVINGIKTVPKVSFIRANSHEPQWWQTSLVSQTLYFSLLSLRKCELVNTQREIMIHCCYFHHSKQKSTNI